MNSRQSTLDWLKIYAFPTLALVVGVAVSLGLYWQLSAMDRQEINERFHRMARKQSKHLQWNLTNYMHALHSAVDLFNSKDRVGKADFRKIGQVIQTRYPEVLALEWLPKVDHNNRQEFVDNLRQKYDRSYRITELSRSGQLRSASPRETYYPVTYVEPWNEASYNRNFLGFDHFSLPIRRVAINKARDRGSITVTPSTVFPRTGQTQRVITSSENNLGVILYKPVFNSSRTVRGEPDEPVGVIALLVEIESLMDPVFKNTEFPHNVAVYEHREKPRQRQTRLIYANQPIDQQTPSTKIQSKLNFQDQFAVSNRSWSLFLWPTSQYIHSQESWGPSIALAFGLLLTGVFVRGAYWLSGEFLGQKEQFQSVINSTEDAIVSTDKQGRVLLWNQAAEDIFGYTHDEIMGKPITVLFSDTHGTDNQHDVGDFIENEESDLRGRTLELEGVRKNNEEVPLEVSTSSWEQQGNTYFTFLMRDISQRVSREEELEKLNENLEQTVEQRTEELQQFVYAASHDLREPARVMQMYAGLLEDDLETQLTPEVQKDLKFIRQSATQMNELIDSLLKLSRTGQDTIDRQEIELETCVDQALEQQENRLRQSNPTIHRDDLPTVYADPALMTDLYQNLISNAIKHAQNGQLEINITADQQNGEWVFGVKDNGPGIDPDFQDSVFEPFTHLPAADGDGGTGIGLSICRRIVERHEGRIWVESSPGEGSHFKFTISQVE